MILFFQCCLVAIATRSCKVLIAASSHLKGESGIKGKAETVVGWAK